MALATEPDQSHSTIEKKTAQPTSAFPMIQPMKAALYFDSVEGFGEWRILLSTRATQDLRESKRNDGSTFKVIVKKIKYILLNSLVPGTLSDQSVYRELSNGQFSADNQKRLNGHDMGIHIFEAKMTRDLRLVVSRIIRSEKRIKLIHYH